VTQAGFEPRVVDVAPMALYNAAMWHYPDMDGCTLVVDIGARSTNLVYVERGRFFSRTVPIAGNAITQDIAKTFQMDFKKAEALKREVAFIALGGNYAPAEDEQTDAVSKIVRTVVTRLHAEINRSTNFYKSQQGGNAPVRVLLTGGSSVIPYMDTFFREKLQVDVQFFNPFERIDIGPKVDRAKLGTDAFVMADIVGLAVRQTKACEILINLIPQAILRRQTFQKKLPALAAAMIGVAAILVLWGVNARFNAEQYRRQAGEVNARLDDLKGFDQRLKASTRELDAVRATADAYRDTLDQRTRWIRILSQLQDALKPMGEIEGRPLANSIWLTRVEPVVEGGQVARLRISGRAWNDDMTHLEKVLASQGNNQTAIASLVERLKQHAVFVPGAVIEREAYSADNTLRLFQLLIPLNP